ncbi:NADH-dependent flavin oxidoreductase [Candidatus Symbiopectobacterium sp. NZEC135]|uniref:NADH-dependent flavin oxidoreductase n=1 Tax=Candidatus Symbiopectobacterium sp. NZEC135 TaxID=2820471 RepID=UPI0022279282|nr:NADH-dependent flavin oxidoreductase [Candidatus Symbiopectobacterium sp. NZEC135]MCW2481172.1 NADH-dependent flavin oxidoreductase [Candidatus Symbiopectobacterium sp. NZEC135]
MTTTKSSLFQPFSFKNGLTLRNRAVMAPMTTWSANPDGTISDQEVAYYRARVNGVGMVVTGCTHVTPNGIGFTDEFASHDDRFIPSLRRLAETAKSGGAPAILQIFHAGNKALPHLVPDNRVVSASALKVPPSPFNPAEVTSHALSKEEIEEIIKAFGETTRRAIEAGFDGVELHGAHGFLIQNFFSPMFNQRNDEWGGSLENRMSFPLAVVREAQRVIAEHAKRPFLLGYRISPDEPGEGALRISDSYVLIDRLIEAGIDYLHASLFNIPNAKPVDYTGEQTTAELIVKHVADRIPLIAAGLIRTPEDAEKALAIGLSLVAIGQGLVMNPTWVKLAGEDQKAEIATALDAEHVPQLAIPDNLWGVIQTAKGWFPLVEATSPAA